MQERIVEEHARSTRILLCILGIGIISLTLVTPMDLFGNGYMFTVHMTQHLLLGLAGPPLLLLSIPDWRLHHVLGKHRIVARGIGILTFPVVASVLFNGNLWIWHAPPLFQAMMVNSSLRIFANLLYIITGLLFWWPLLNPLQQEKSALSLGGKLAYLFFSDMPMMLLGAGLTFTSPLYSFVMSNPPMQMNITATDQQLGGLLMWVVGSIFFIVVASIFFLRWMNQQDIRQRAQEAEMYHEEEVEEEEIF